MIDLRPAARLGRFQNDWLDTRYHFSFADWYDPERMGWGDLRVWNDDEIAPGTGFGAHGHADMEIITYVRQGAVTHRDSLGNVGRTAAGEVQVMSAGAGIRHSEVNAEAEPTRLFQIWIEPTVRGGAPAWGMRRFPESAGAGALTVLASGRAGDGDALPIRADARILGATLGAGERVRYAPEAGRHTYLALAAGSARLNGLLLGPRDGAAIRDEAVLEIEAVEDAELVLVDTR